MSRYKLTLPFANFFSRNFTGSFWIVVLLVIACSYFNERCASLSSGDRFLSLASLSGDNLGTKLRKNMKIDRKYGEKEKIQILIKSLIFRTLRIYIFSFYAFLFFVSLADAEL